MADFVYRVTFADGSMCHTGYGPLAVVWAKAPGSKMEEIELKSPTRLRIVNSGDSVSDFYERAFTGANRRPAMWAAFQAGWEAAMRTGEPSRNPLANQAETSSSPIATVHDPYDTPGIQWHCQHPPATGTKLYTREDQ